MNAPVRPSLPRGLYVLCDDTVHPELPRGEKAARLLAGGARVVQLRMKRTPTRQVPAPVLGLGGLAEVVRASPLSVVGIGGVKLENIAEVAATGSYGGAVASDALLAKDIAERGRRLTAAFDRGARGASLAGGDA